MRRTMANMAQKSKKSRMIRATISAYLKFGVAAILSAAIVSLIVGGEARVVFFTPLAVVSGIKYGIGVALHIGAIFALPFWARAFRKSFCQGRICTYLVNHGAVLGFLVVLLYHLPSAMLLIDLPAEFSPLTAWSTTAANFVAGTIGGYYSAPVLRQAADAGETGDGAP